MKVLGTLPVMLAAAMFAGAAAAQTPNYQNFSTIDEANNIEVFKLASPSVVNITNSRFVRSFYSRNPQAVPQGNGSGFIWSEDGYIVTNYHVIQQADSVSVTLQDGSTHAAGLRGVDPDKDLAVLKIEPGELRLTPIPLGDSSLLEVGRKVIAIGDPFGLDTTMTVGVVSALGREIDALSGRKIRDVIQTDAAINPGNSGGPLLNSLGQLVGVNTAIFSPSGANSGIGFAIPVNTVKRVVPELIQYGRMQTPFLGISQMPQPDYYRRLWGIEGVIVLDVVDGAGPQRAGMRGLSRNRLGRLILGDVIVAIDGEPVRDEDDLASMLERYRGGDTITVTSMRDNRRIDYEIELLAPASR